MKKILFVLNPLFPNRDHNSNLVLRIAPYMNAESEILTLDTSTEESFPPEKIDGIPTSFAKCRGKFNERLLSVFKIFLKEEASNFFRYIKMSAHIKRASNENDIVFSTYQWNYAAFAALKSSKKTVKALYLMDPFTEMYTPGLTAYDDRKWNIKMLKKYDVIFTTRFIKEAISKRGYASYVKRVVEVSFPMITGFSEVSEKKDDGKITLLFAGTIYDDIRSPDYYLKIVSKLDSRFKVAFIGYNCKSLKKLSIDTGAELTILPRMSYDEIKKEMAKADILINIGNSVPVHIPSKIFEYINTGKPFVNFYKLDDCPSLYYTNRYPLCLNLSEKDEDIDAVAEKFIDFCIKSKDKRLEQEWIKENYKESTPEFIAKQIDDTLTELCEQKRKR